MVVWNNYVGIKSSSTTYLINWQNVTIVVICGLPRSKVGGREIPPDFVIVKVCEVFILEMMVPNVDETPRPMDPQCPHMKISPRATNHWSCKFLELDCDARGNHGVSL
jgi:hypothetical protein